MLQIDTANDLLAVLTILSILLAGLMWLIRTEVRGIKTETAQIKHETTPNSGSSMKDKINVMYDIIKASHESEKEWRREQMSHNDRIYTSLTDVHRRVDAHLNDHIHDAREA